MIAGTVAFIASGLGFVMTAARSLRPQVPLLVVTGVATAACSAYLIPRYGLMGAADASLLAAIVQLVGTGIILVRVDKGLANAPVSSYGTSNLASPVFEVEVV